MIFTEITTTAIMDRLERERKENRKSINKTKEADIMLGIKRSDDVKPLKQFFNLIKSPFNRNTQ